VKKELRPVHDVVSCDVCGRTILKGERTEAYLAPGGQRHQVCDLCAVRAQQSGWIRESAAGDMPTRTPRSEPRRGVLGRLRRRWPPHEPAPPPEPQHEAELAQHEATWGGENGAEPAEYEEPQQAPAPPAPPAPRPRTRPKDPRHVRAVPTTAEGKMERAVDLFNGSDHQRTIAGLARTLGTPFVGVTPDADQPSQVSLVVAWELSWYRYRVDLGDEGDPVMMLEKGDEIDQIDAGLREWNATMDASGRVLSGGQAVTDGGGEA
jgi:hypothetical protein